MIFPRRDLFWVFVHACVHMYTLLWGVYVRFEDLEDKKDIHEDFFCPSNPCYDQILTVLCSSPPSCIPWTTRTLLALQCCKTSSFKIGVRGWGMRQKKHPSLYPTPLLPITNGCNKAEFRALCTPGQTRALQDMTALICACPAPTRDKRQCQE